MWVKNTYNLSIIKIGILFCLDSFIFQMFDHTHTVRHSIVHSWPFSWLDHASWFVRLISSSGSARVSVALWRRICNCTARSEHYKVPGEPSVNKQHPTWQPLIFKRLKKRLTTFISSHHSQNVCVVHVQLGFIFPFSCFFVCFFLFRISLVRASGLDIYTPPDR